MQNLREAATKELEHQRAVSEVPNSDDEGMGSAEESVQEEDLMAADGDSDGRAAGASQHAASKGKGAPSSDGSLFGGTRREAQNRKKKK